MDAKFKFYTSIGLSHASHTIRNWKNAPFQVKNTKIVKFLILAPFLFFPSFI